MRHRLGLALLCAGLLAACGGGEAEPGTSADGPPDTTTERVAVVYKSPT